MKAYQFALLALLPAVLAAPQGKGGKGNGANAQGAAAQNANKGGNAAAANQGGNAAANQGANANQGAANQGGNQAASNGTALDGSLTLQPPNSNAGASNAAANAGNAGGVENFNTAQAKVDQQTAELMQTAVEAWRIDTGRVSNFLNTGNALATGDPNVFKNAANVAASAEVDELTHKQVLDQFMPNDQNVKAANATLSNGAFQLVVDKLQNMATNGPASAQQDIDDINNDRCVNVLPNIDAYMKSAALTIGDPNVVQSVRPAACGDITQKAAGNNNAQQQNVDTANQLSSQFAGENPGSTQQDQRLPVDQRQGA